MQQKLTHTWYMQQIANIKWEDKNALLMLV